jgi:DNA repair photolyase
MFPTSHDITPRNLKGCVETIHYMLGEGRKVLVVSKPHFECVSVMLDEFEDQTDNVEFRFTLGALSKPVLAFWEPGAPSAFERLHCIEYAASFGFKVSVSAEPCLDWGIQTVHLLAEACFQAGADHIWFGMLNQWERRLAHLTDAQRAAEPYQVLRKQHEDPGMIREHCASLRQVYGEKVVWKDSIKKLLGEG